MSRRHVTKWPFPARDQRGSMRLDHQTYLTARQVRYHIAPAREQVSRSDSWGRSAQERDILWDSPIHISHDGSVCPPTERGIARLLKERQISINVHGRVDVVDSLRLRDACSCKLCVDPSTTQKLFSTVDIPNHIRAEVDQIHADGSFSVSWTADVPGFKDHISHYASEFLPKRTDFRSIMTRAHRESPRISWGRDSLPKPHVTFDFDRYMNDTTTLPAITKSLMQYGLAFISDVPSDVQSVGSMASRIGPTMKTIYGETWDVRSVKSPKNVANGDSDLDFHMVCVIWG